MSLKKRTLNGVLWTGIQQFSSQGISFFVSIILARLLLPEEFALLAMISIILALGQTLTDSGLTSSLIRTTDPDDEDFSTVFYFNVAVSVLLYLIAYLTAPFVAQFYNKPILIDLVRVLALNIIITSTYAVQRTRLTKRMDFKTQMLVGVPALIIGSGIGITLAYLDYGVWSLVFMRLIVSSVESVSFWIHSKWIPLWVFNLEKFKYHFSFGNRLALSGIIDTFFRNIYTIVIGKFFPAAQLGFYARANSLKQLPVNNLSAILAKVTFPMFSDIKDDFVRLKSVCKRVLQMTIFIIAPVLLIMAALATPLFELLFTDKWLPAVPYFRILCLSGLLYPIHAYNLNILNVLGRSDLFLRLEIIKKMLVLCMVLLTFKFGIYGLLYGAVANSVLSLFINGYYSGKFINYFMKEQLVDLLPTILIAFLVAAIVYFGDNSIFFSGLSNLARTVIGTFFGVTLYLGISKLLKLDSLAEVLSIVNVKRNRKVDTIN